MPDQSCPDFPIIGFAAGTPIHTPGGSTPVEVVKPGDVVLTRPRPVGRNGRSA